MLKPIGFDTETYAVKHVERLLSNKAGNRIRSKTLFPSFYQLENYCKAHDIDTSEIDHKISLQENLEILKALIPKNYSYDLSDMQLKETDYLPENEMSHFYTQEFYSAQFFNPELKINKFITDSKEVPTIFRYTTRGAIFLANNAEFDFAVLAKILDKHEYQLKCLYNGSRFLYGKINQKCKFGKESSENCVICKDKRCLKNCWKIVDLMNIFNFWSLAKIGKFLGIEKMKKPEYLGKRMPESDTEKLYFQNYAMRDAEIGYEAGKWLLKKFGKIRVSLPSLSFNYFNKNYKPQGLYLRVDSELTAKLRLAYKGGRVESWIRGSPIQEEFCYDAVSLYPSVMKEKAYPCGINGLKKKFDINLSYDGIALVTVKQDTDIPFLGLKVLCKDKNVKLIFPNGTFKAWFTYPELRYFSLLNLGKIVTVHEAWETQGSKFYFKDYIDEFFNLKNSDKEHADFWKLCMNSLYGKFAQDAHSPELQFNEDNSISQIKDFGNKRENFQTNILVSAYVCGFGRIKMHKNYRQCGAENLVYTDTDSIHSFKELNGVGTDLGQLAFKVKGNGIYVRSKFYIFNDMVRCRGMERIFSKEHVCAMIARNDVSIMSKVLLRLRSAYRQHKPFLTETSLVKSFSLFDDCKRVYTKQLIGSQLLNDYTDSVAVSLNGVA